MAQTSLEQVMQFNCYRAGLLLRRELMHALKDYELTPEQWQILATLWDSGQALSQAEIAEVVLKDRHSVSRLVQRLLDKGWVERLDDDTDARIVRIRASKSSRRVESKIRSALYSHFDHLLSDLTVSEKEQLTSLLKRLRRALGDDVA